MAEGSFAPIPDRDPAHLDQPINPHPGFLTDDKAKSAGSRQRNTWHDDGELK
jgi:hypothetical protein